MTTTNNKLRLLAALLLACTAGLAQAYVPAGARLGSAAIPGQSQHAGSATHTTVATTTTLAPSATSSSLGSTVTLTATVNGSRPGGSVSFYDGSTLIGSGTLNAGTASLAYKWTVAGSHAMSASYPGDANNAASTSAAVRLGVATASVSLALSGSPQVAVAGQAVTLRASATGVSPSGSIVFKDGTSALGTASLSAGSASLTVSFPSAGVHSLSASYAGDSNNGAATSAALSETINPAAASVSLASSAPQAIVSAPVTLKATVTGASPTGSVSFRDGTTALGSAPLSGGAASLSVAFSAAGSHALSAVYSGDRNNAAASSAALAESVGLASSSLSLAASATSVKVGQSVTLSAKLSADNKAGSVVFKDGTTALGSVALANGLASFTAVIGSVGNHALSAAFAGNSSTGGSASAAVTVAAAMVTPTVTLAGSSTSVTAGQTYTLSAAVSGYQPGGTLAVLDNGVQLGSVAMKNGSATFATPFTKVGSHALSARYSGDANNAAATSASFNLTVNAALTLNLAATPTSVTVGKGSTLAASFGGGTQSGTLTFMVNGGVLGTTKVSGTGATMAFTPTAAGSYTLSASFATATATVSSNSVTVTATSSSKTPQTNNGIAYNGGTVMSQGANIYYIWYGTWSGSTTPTILDNFIKGLGGSPYYHINTSYSDNSGASVQDSLTLMGETSDNYSQGKALSDYSVQTIVDSALSRGALPVDPNGIYLVMTSKDVDETSGFCTQYCGWHTYYMRGATGIKYGFIGSADRCAAACGANMPNPPNGNGSADAMASVVVHEISETVTDPYLNGWHNSDWNENGDLCAWNFGATTTANGKTFNVTLPTGQFMIQQMWLNDRGGGCTRSYP